LLVVFGWLSGLGAGPWLGRADRLGWLGGFGGGAEVVVALFDAAGLDLVTPGLPGVDGGCVWAVGRVVWAFNRRLGGVIGTVGGHRTS
jgi:hypothetical protein